MATTESARTVIAQLYVALFGRAPDAGGLAYWSSMRDAGQPVAQLADAMFGVAPARAYFPAGATNAQVVASFYLNVLGRAADAEGLAYWTGKMNAAGATPGSVIAEMVFNVANYVGNNADGLKSAALFNNRAAAAKFYGDHAGAVDGSAALIQSVTENPATVTAAQTLRLTGDSAGTFEVNGYGNVIVDRITGDIALTGVADNVTISFGNTVPPPSNVLYATLTLAEQTGSDHLSLVHQTVSGGRAPYTSVNGLEHVTLTSNTTAAQTVVNAIRLTDADLLKTVTIVGGADVEFSAAFYSQLERVDASRLAGDFFFYGTRSSVRMTLESGVGNDVIASSEGGNTNLSGGSGDDLLIMHAGDMATGGPGDDSFWWSRTNTAPGVFTIVDFQPAGMGRRGDWVQLLDWGDFITFNSDKIMLPSDAELIDYLNVAAAGNTDTMNSYMLRWFQWHGNSYLVMDASASTEFVAGPDQFIQFTGLVDLGQGELLYRSTFTL